MVTQTDQSYSNKYDTMIYVSLHLSIFTLSSVTISRPYESIKLRCEMTYFVTINHYTIRVINPLNFPFPHFTLIFEGKEIAEKPIKIYFYNTRVYLPVVVAAGRDWRECVEGVEVSLSCSWRYSSVRSPASSKHRIIFSNFSARWYLLLFGSGTRSEHRPSNKSTGMKKGRKKDRSWIISLTPKAIDISLIWRSFHRTFSITVHFYLYCWRWGLKAQSILNVLTCEFKEWEIFM